MARKNWKTLEKEWSKIKPVTMTKTGVAAIMRDMSKKLNKYNRDGHVKDMAEAYPTLPKKLEVMYQKLFDDGVKGVTKKLKSDSRLLKNKKTKAFLQDLTKDMGDEVSFWAGTPASNAVARASKEWKGLIGILSSEQKKMRSELARFQKESPKLLKSVPMINEEAKLDKLVQIGDKFISIAGKQQKKLVTLKSTMQKEALNIGQLCKAVVNNGTKVNKDLVKDINAKSGEGLRLEIGKLEMAGIEIKSAVDKQRKAILKAK